ncbi:MAG: AMP-binding protein, partial [Burkholderiaceae bacterium]
MNIASYLYRQCLLRASKTAIFFGTTPWASFEQWGLRSNAIARRLQKLGLKPGDRVLLLMVNHPRYLELVFACWWIGLVVVPVNFRLHTKEVEWIIQNSGAYTGFVSEGLACTALNGLTHQITIESHEFLELLDVADPYNTLQEPAVLQPDDTAWLFYTSGTTGRPKGVQITHRNLLSMGLGYFADVDFVGPDDHMVYAAPMSHGAGLYSVPHVIAGACHVVPESGGVNAQELFELGQALGPLSTFAPPTIVNKLVQYVERIALSPEDCAKVFKTIVYGGAPMYVADMKRALLVMGPRFVHIYGQGETPMVATVLSRQALFNQSHERFEQRLASVGVAQSPVLVRVVDSTGSPVPAGQTGEVAVRGDTVMKGYWENPSATAAAVRDGWLLTGDVGVLDSDGFLTLKDRSKDLIISGGANIYPREVEEALLTNPAVEEVA